MKILLVIVLKIVEIAGLIFIPYFLGKPVITHITHERSVGLPISIIWLAGLVPVLIIVLILLIIFAIVPSWFELNWNIVNQIIK